MHMHTHTHTCRFIYTYTYFCSCRGVASKYSRWSATLRAWLGALGHPEEQSGCLLILTGVFRSPWGTPRALASTRSLRDFQSLCQRRQKCAFHALSHCHACVSDFQESNGTPSVLCGLRPSSEGLSTSVDTSSVAGHILGSPSERAKGWGAVWAKSGRLVQYYCHMLLAMLGMGEGERAITSAGSRA